LPRKTQIRDGERYLKYQRWFYLAHSLGRAERPYWVNIATTAPVEDFKT
jgi:hypothetical protein